MSHRTPGNLRGFVQVRMRSLKSGSMAEHRFSSEDKVEKAVMDYSMLDAWLSLLHADCSALHIVRPVPVTDFTRCSTLSALFLPRIAPRSILCARAGRGSLRATDCSVVQHLELCTACGILRTRYLAFRVAFGLLHTRRFPLCTAHGLLRARCLALHAGLRIAPYADILRPYAGHGLLHVRH